MSSSSLALIENWGIFFNENSDKTALEKLSIQSVQTSIHELFGIIEQESWDFYDEQQQLINAFIATARLRNLLILYGLELSTSAIRNIDMRIRSMFAVWTASLQKKMIPRPANLGDFPCFSGLLAYFNNFVRSFSISSSVRGTESMLLLGCGTNTLGLVDQIGDFLIVAISHAHDHFLLNGNRERLMEEYKNIMFKTMGRLRRHVGCARVLRQLASISSLLNAPDQVALQEFTDYLIVTGKFTRTLQDDGSVQFVSNSLIRDTAKYALFKYSTVDRSSTFFDEFRITVDTTKLAVTVEGRNSWAKDRWVSEITSKFRLSIVRAQMASVATLNQWMGDVQHRLETIVLIMMWGVHLVRRESLLELDPTFVLTCYYYCCSFALDTLETADGAISCITKDLWRATGRKICSWIAASASFWHSESPKLAMENTLLALNHLARYMHVCPNNNLIPFNSLCSSLQRLQAVVLSPAAATQSSELLAHFLDCCLERCRSNCSNFVSPIKNTKGTGIKFPTIIGGGTYGIVYKCFDLKLNSAIALKEIRLSKANGNLAEEVCYLKFLKHCNIVAFLDAVTTDEAVYLKTELCQGGSLLDLITAGPPPDSLSFRRIMVQILLGLTFLHGNNIIHGDLKPGNILLDRFGVVKLADFGTSHCLAKDRQAFPMGTLPYMAPEVILGGQATHSSDIWSLGCTLFQLATGLAPYAECEGLCQTLLTISQGRLFDLAPLYKAPLEPWIQQLICSCLSFNPIERPLTTILLLNNNLYG
ncbi:Mitogen-activated protein kinase kinase kinase 3 [Paramicrosporidium saccamoebae]|uniref:Mitogen-activated protein kinase kinase kinase 3 n=1 Tax=Paramicrosporidium saccamoebae TaxID=1246581 RepID=A0A2H9TPE0_9FUNG|nr:Mitogen-activated protein kinase kinase kinase 3 [Paramicrosporidium saccamoebae]